jgi:hypothetical protein
MARLMLVAGHETTAKMLHELPGTRGATKSFASMRTAR